MIYLPFGFDSMGHWEEWNATAYFEGLETSFRKEYPIRFFIMLPNTLAAVIDRESFLGYHFVQVAVITLQSTLIYGIARKLGVRELFAFLVAALFFAYPANDLLLSTRSVLHNTSVLYLLLAAYCALDYLATPRWRTLLGVALALFFNVGSYEAGLAAIVALPFFLWLRRGKLDWRLVNLSLLWISAAAFKLGYLLLVVTTDRPFYQSEFLDSQNKFGARFLGQNIVSTIGEVIPQVYRQTFVEGWVEAFSSLADNQWLLPTLLALLCTGGMAMYLAGRDSSLPPPSLRQVAISLGSGFLLIVPAVGVLMWLPGYNSGDVQQLYFYVSAPAACAVFCLLLLITAKLKDQRARDYALIALCLLLMLPALSRLFVQHEMYTRSADKNALFLRQILELVPRPNPDTYLLMITPMTRVELADKQISHFSYSTVFTSALSTLYADHAPADSFFCRFYHRCSWRWGKSDLFELHEHADYWQDTIVLELRRDLVVELVEDPFTRYGWDIDIEYDPSQLYDADAPLPPRANSMLGAAIRRGAD